MSALLRSDGPHPGRRTGAVGLVALVVLLIAGLFAPSTILHGWLIAFVNVCGIALGCTAWRAIHALTGGRWGEVGTSGLRAGSTLMPLTVVLVLPPLFAARWLYPWAADAHSVPSDVHGFYLNGWSVGLRSLALLGGLSFVAWRNRQSTLSPLIAALTLLLYGGLMNLSAFDWLLSLDPRYTSSAIGMQIIVAQLLAGLCFLVLVTDAPEGDRVWGDFGALLLACLLGELYLLFMTFVVHWYGDLPDQAAWYLLRTQGVWHWLVIVGTALCALAPALALLFTAVRTSRSRLRTLAALILFGLLLEYIWLVAPQAGAEAGWAIAAALAANLTIGALALAVLEIWRARAGFVEGGSVAHG